MDDVLNVRTGPGVANAISSAIPPYGTAVQTLGKQEQVGAATWVLVRYKENTGWVNSSYLARQVGLINDPVSARATEIVHALREKDWEALSAFVHPDKGLRFSPYTFVRVEADASLDALADRQCKIHVLRVGYVDKEEWLVALHSRRATSRSPRTDTPQQ